jgi:hypothetical protein
MPGRANGISGTAFARPQQRAKTMLKDETHDAKSAYEAALRRHEAVLRRLIEHMNDGVLDDDDLRDEETARNRLNSARYALFDHLYRPH